MSKATYRSAPNFAGVSLSVGDEVWVRAVVTDPCTSCVGVKIDTIHKQHVHTYVRPKDALPASTGCPPSPGNTSNEKGSQG